MDGVKIICGCAFGLVLIGQVAALPAGTRTAFWNGLQARPAAPLPRTAPPALLRADAGPPTGVGAGTIVIEPDRFGQFQTDIEVEGQRIPVLIDTGASFVLLRYEDADRLGIRPMPSDFKYNVSTANGLAAYARTELPDVRLDGIPLRGLTAFVSPRGALFRTLFGMNALARLRGFRIENGRLVIQR